VIGQIHGNEPAGRSVITRLRATKVPADTAIWTIMSMNPDGSAAGSRRNARGVDLNRNFPTKWQPKAYSPSRNPGPSPASEPETKAVMAFINKLRPDGVITFHQALFAVDTSDPRTKKWATMLANGIKLPMKAVPCGGVCGGTMGQWVIAKHYSASTGSGWSVVVELPGSPVASKWITRSVRTVVRVAAAQHP
jgi:protein MpaA